VSFEKRSVWINPSFILMVAKHFCQKNHGVKKFKVIGIEKTGNGSKFTEKLRIHFG
jgi:ribonuclease HIII